MRILFVSAVLVFADQITKAMVRNTMSLYESIPVISDFFHITYVTNDGMAFGINFPFGIYVFTGISIVFTGFLFWYLWTIQDHGLIIRTGIALILAGAIGNLIDRVFILMGMLLPLLNCWSWGIDMPIKYKILKNRKFVYAVGEGQISFDDLLQHVNELAEDPKYVSPNLTQTKKLDGLTVEELIEQFKLVREDTIAIVQGMSEQDLNREGMHAFHGHGKLERFIIWAYEHVRIHEDEIRKVIH